MNPVRPENAAPMRKQTTRQIPFCENVIATDPSARTTLVAVKKMSTARGTTMSAIVRNCRRRNASAPSWIALAISRIRSDPESAASTPRATITPATMPITPQAITAQRISRSCEVSTKFW